MSSENTPPRPDHIWVCVCEDCRKHTLWAWRHSPTVTPPGYDRALRECAFFRLALLDIHSRESAQDSTTCWVRSRYEPFLSLTKWVEKVLDDANALEEST